MKENPTNMYVDVGGSIDSFTKGTPSRLYTDPEHPFSKESCVFVEQNGGPSVADLEIVPIIITEVTEVTEASVSESPKLVNEIVGGSPEPADMLQLLKNYKANLYKGNKVDVTPAMCGRYTWGEGYIQFSLGGALHTTWKEGTYVFLDATTVQAKWSTHNHIIRLNDNYDAYTAIHMDTLVVSTGVLESESVFIYDDCLIENGDRPGQIALDVEASRYLLYACVFHKKSYIELLKILLASYKFFSRTDGIDFVVFTSKEFEAEILEFGAMIGIQIECQIFDFTTIHESSCARLYVFDYAKINLYKKAIYLDTDIIIQGDLLKIFELEIGDQIYALNEGTIDHEIHGGWFFDFTKISKQTPALNGGIMLFKITGAIRFKFNTAIAHIEHMKARGGRMPECWDQPFLNYHFIKDGIHDMVLMNQYAKIYCDEPPPPPSAPTDVSICHFVWPLGNAEHKRKRMEAHLSHILKNYQKIYPTQEPLDVTNILGRRYCWGNGYIEFFPNGVLNTIWSAGTYSMLDSRTAYVSWNNFNHIIKLDDTLNTYISFRIGDLNMCCGKQKANPICIYGDSHAIMFIKLSKLNTNLFDFGKTMHSVGRDCRIVNFYPGDLDENSTVCLVYGEVDVRCHIGKQVLLGRDVGTICKTLVENYFVAIRKLITAYKQIIIVAVPPPTDPKDHTHTDVHGTVLPFIGTNSERVQYTAIMNRCIERNCLEYGYTYFNPYSFYTREDGCLNYSLSDGCIHIGDTVRILDEFEKLV